VEVKDRMSQDVREEREKAPDSSESGEVVANPSVRREAAPGPAGASEADQREPVRPAKTGVPLRPAATPMKSGKTSGLQRAVGFVRFVAPMVQKVLPLLEGNVAMVVTNLLAPRPTSSHVDLQPIESAVAKMRKDHLDLRLSVADQTAALKRIADQVEAVKDSTAQNSLETKEIAGDVQRLKAKMNAFAWAGLVLLVLSIVINIVFFMEIRQLMH
jgi:hypothetical protein